MLTNDSYALLIGVDDYTGFDASRGAASGTSDLPGSTNDVRAMWRLCRRLGIEAAHIRVLASPMIDFHELPGATAENVAPATRAGVLGGAGWLAGKLAQRSRPTGILTYSGHGDWQAGEGLVLCPTDVTATGDGADLLGGVSFHDLNALLAGHAENLTVVLDACHSGPVGPREDGSRALSLTGRPLTRDPDLGEALAGRVLCAALRDQVAYQALFDGQFRGVFSWALGAALDQWRATPQGDNVVVDVTYGKLVETAERIVSALWFDQIPRLQARPGVADLAVLQRRQDPRPERVSARPDGLRKAAQVDPGYKDYLIYQVLDANNNLLAQVLVAKTTNPGGTWVAGNEYWYMTTNFTGQPSVTFSSGASQYWSNAPTLSTTYSFSVPSITTWTQSSARLTLFNYQSPSGGGGALEFDGLVWSMSNSTGSWHGTITWWSQQGTGFIFNENTTRVLSSSHVVITNYYEITQTV
jgi:hypothetical protein